MDSEAMNLVRKLEARWPLHLHLSLRFQRPPSPNAGEAAGTHIRVDQLICGSLNLLAIQQGQARRSRYTASSGTECSIHSSLADKEDDVEGGD
jgi:hypothetical protein